MVALFDLILTLSCALHEPLTDMAALHDSFSVNVAGLGSGLVWIAGKGNSQL